MENASKALIIAGAILISIVLIAIGVLIVGSMQGTVDESIASMSDQEKQSFNAKFERYQKTKQSSGNVKTLLGLVLTNNQEYEEDGASEATPKQVRVTVDADGNVKPEDVEDAEGAAYTTDEISGEIKKIKSGATYNVIMVVDRASGLIHDIFCLQNGV